MSDKKLFFQVTKSDSMSTAVLRPEDFRCQDLTGMCGTPEEPVLIQIEPEWLTEEEFEALPTFKLA